MEIRINVPNGYEEMAANYTIEAVRIAVRETLSQEYGSNIIEDQVAEICSVISAQDENGKDLLSEPENTDNTTDLPDELSQVGVSDVADAMQDTSVISELSTES